MIKWYTAVCHFYRAGFPRKFFLQLCTFSVARFAPMAYDTLSITVYSWL